MKTFNLYSYTVAKEILNTKNQTDVYGSPLWSNTDSAWSIEVVTWFATLYQKAKSFVGVWCLRIKLAWFELTTKAMETMNIIIKKSHRFSMNPFEDCKGYNIGITANYRTSKLVKNNYKLRKQRCEESNTNRLQRSLNY